MRQSLIHSTTNYPSIMKSLIIAGLLLGTAGAAQAGPYVNVETNAGWYGSESVGSGTDMHVGFEGTAGATSYYIQGGPQIQTPNGGSTEVVFSAQAGAGVDLTEKLNVYGEVSVATGVTDDIFGGSSPNSYGAKVGAKYSF